MTQDSIESWIKLHILSLVLISYHGTGSTVGLGKLPVYKVFKLQLEVFISTFLEIGTNSKKWDQSCPGCFFFSSIQDPMEKNRNQTG
jgi:hypothetical protein